MVVEPHTTFRFVFRGITSKSESLNKLRQFLHENKWLSEHSDYDTDLLGYHTDYDGTCEVKLKKCEGFSTEELADEFFSDLCDAVDVRWVKVLYNGDTAKLIYNHCDKYMEYQTVDIAELKENDEVVILFRK